MRILIYNIKMFFDKNLLTLIDLMYVYVTPDELIQTYTILMHHHEFSFSKKKKT